MKITFSRHIDIDVSKMIGEYIQVDDKVYRIEATDTAFDDDGVTTKALVLGEVDIPWPRILE